jgi:transcriptional regulator GlxA family with amidase domain
VIFLVLPDVEILDLAGPLQAFCEVNVLSPRYDIRLVSTQKDVGSAQEVKLTALRPLESVTESALVIVPGVKYAATQRVDRRVVRWLRDAYASGATIASICTGSFLLGEAGLLDGRRCTTHWSRVSDLARRFPRAQVLDDRLFVRDGRILSSAGIVSGIDLALSMIEARHGPLIASQVAREMVVYIRRDGAHQQSSIYLDFRAHMNPGVHRVQDWLIQNLQTKAPLETLAGISGMSSRNLTRRFREATGVTIKAYTTRLRLELAQTLRNDPGLSVETIARRCGFSDARQLRRLWQPKLP